jgi:predicted amidohydrolase
MQIEVAAAQIPIGWDIDQNLTWIADAVRDAGNADLLVLPEGSISGYDPDLTGLQELTPETVEGAIEEVAATAARHGVHVFCGSLLYDTRAWCNAALSISPSGLGGIYRKVNLATRERGRLMAGDQLKVFPTELGEPGVAVGCQICRELRFAEQWHALARCGAQLFAYLTYAAERNAPEDVWRSHLISRAAETQRFVIASNVADPHQHCPTMIVTPRGEVLAEAERGSTELIRATIDLSAVADSYLDQQRDDVVRIEACASACSSRTPFANELRTLRGRGPTSS